MIMKIAPDKEKARSIANLVLSREKFTKTINIEDFPTIASENYYEIIKELIAAILLTDGIKSFGENAHKDLIDYLSNYEGFNQVEISLMQDLRIKRNQSSYEGKEIHRDYLKDRLERLKNIIEKLKEILEKKLR